MAVIFPREISPELMPHFGLEGEVPNLNGAISHSLIAPLKKHVHYLDVGHVHKAVTCDGWIYNPGSLEAWGMDERNWHGGWQASSQALRTSMGGTV